jgi:D-glycero-D-manno-heptose 1,7-bisphosphate phosphatase
MTWQNPVLYLDIDGTVRHGREQLGRFVNGPDDVVVFPEAVEMMRRWRARGGRIVGVSNQGGIALGIMTHGQCQEAMRRTQQLTGGRFDRIVFCPHHPQARDPAMAQCWCRKPFPGMIIKEAALLEYECPNDGTFPPHLALMVGDRPEDEQCARNANIDFQWAHEWRAQAHTPEED